MGEETKKARGGQIPRRLVKVRRTGGRNPATQVHKDRRRELREREMFKDVEASDVSDRE